MPLALSKNGFIQADPVTGRTSVEWIFAGGDACPGGCIGGGGQPRLTTNEVRLARIRAIYAEDEGKKLRKSHENPEVRQIYAEFLGKPLGERSHHLLHTTYTKPERV
jgi:iron only hydrogenase large subunit-like protein